MVVDKLEEALVEVEEAESPLYLAELDLCSSKFEQTGMDGQLGEAAPMDWQNEKKTPVDWQIFALTGLSGQPDVALS